MKVIVDAFGGDNAPLSNIEGAALAVKEYGSNIILCGDEQKIKQCAKDNNISLENIEILHADDVFDVHDDPNLLLKTKKNTSLAVAFDAVKSGKADAIVSAGSSGAVLMGGTFIVKRIKGIKRPAFATVLPTTNKPYMLLDSGANIDCRPEILHQFAVVGNAYMKNIFDIDAPRIGLLNIGAEDSKGGEVLVETYQKLKNDTKLNFIGNVEPRDVPTGACDVLVCDGFAGNIVLKLTEGVAKSFMSMFKEVLMKNAIAKLGALMAKGGLKDLKKKFDYKEYGGAPLIGVKSPVIKAHGSSDSKAIKSAIRQAINFTKTNVIKDIEDALRDENNDK